MVAPQCTLIGLRGEEKVIYAWAIVVEKMEAGVGIGIGANTKYNAWDGKVKVKLFTCTMKAGNSSLEWTN